MQQATAQPARPLPRDGNGSCSKWRASMARIQAAARTQARKVEFELEREAEGKTEREVERVTGLGLAERPCNMSPDQAAQWQRGPFMLGSCAWLPLHGVQNIYTH